MMKKFNQEQVDNLRQYEDIFFKAVNQNYYRSMNTKTLEAMVSIYNETADIPYKGNWACSHCVLAFLKLIGSKYYVHVQVTVLSTRRKAYGNGRTCTG